MMKKRIACIALLLMAALAFIGCGKEDVADTFNKAAEVLKSEREANLEMVVQDNSTFKFVILHHGLNEEDHYILHSIITNKSEEPILFKIENSEIDGVHATPDWNVTVEAGESATTDIDLLLPLQETGDNGHEVHFKLYLLNPASNELMFYHGYTFNVNREEEPHSSIEKGAYVEITIPADIANDERAQDAIAETEKALDVERTEVKEDGAIIYRVTNEKYQEIHETVHDVQVNGIESYVSSEFHRSTFPKVEYDDELTHFTVYSNYNYNDEDRYHYGVGLAVYGRLYHCFCLLDYDDTAVEYVFLPTGETYETYHTNPVYNDIDLLNRTLYEED